MSLDLVVNSPLSVTPDRVFDQSENVPSALSLANSTVMVGTGPFDNLSVLGVVATPPPDACHFLVGDPSAGAGQTSATFTLAGFGIQHAGFAWAPSDNPQQASGKLTLAFGKNNDLDENNPVFVFSSNGDLQAPGTITAGSLQLTGLTIQGLSVPPAGVTTVDLVIDNSTGKIYRQS